MSHFIPVKMIVKDGSELTFVNKDLVMAFTMKTERVILLLTDSYRMEVEMWGPIKDLIARIKQDYQNFMTDIK